MSCGTCNKSASVPQQLVNAGEAALRIFSAVVNDQPIHVPPATQQKRLEVCLACEHCQPKGAHHRCQLCGCWLDGETLCKTCLTTETCPLNQWSNL